MAERKRPDPGRVLDLLWGGPPPPPARGPRPKVTLEQIVQAGIDLADTEGLDALSMRRVAGRLGIGTMSLYTYVPGRTELLHLMYDRAVGPTPPPPEGATWRQALRHYAHLDHDLHRTHPWTLTIATPGLMLMSPNSTARAEAVYAALAPLGLPARRQAAIAHSIDAYVRGSGQAGAARLTSADLDGGFTDTDDYEAWWARATPRLAELVTPDRFPRLHAVWEAGAFKDFADSAFDYGLERLLDGIEHHLEHTRTAGGPEEPGE